MSQPFLLGPINQGISFMVVSIQNGQPYVLNQTPTDYYWENDLSMVLPSPPVFAANGSLSNLTIADPSGTSGLGFKADGVTITPTDTPASLQMSQAAFATWAPPALFLSMAVYTLSTLSGTTGQIETAGLTGTVPSTNLILLPLIWYYPGASGTTDCVNTSLNTPGDSLVTWFCNVNPQSYGTCPVPLVSEGWTQLSDCTAGIQYTYCPVNQTCGESNCNGPCPTTATTCTLATGTFSCQGTTELWTEPWFLVLIIGLGLIAVILFIVAIVLANKGSSKNKAKAQPMIESDYVNY